jgi:1-acyl-sn-glycerol-3-phosphate acyltransferase
VCPNHKSFWDSFFIGVATKRHLRFMAKTELIEVERLLWAEVEGEFRRRRARSGLIAAALAARGVGGGALLRRQRLRRRRSRIPWLR